MNSVELSEATIAEDEPAEHLHVLLSKSGSNGLNTLPQRSKQVRGQIVTVTVVHILPCS